MLPSCVPLDPTTLDVTLYTVRLGLRVRRGRHWKTRQWREDVDRTSERDPRPRVAGTVVGFTDVRGSLVGESGRTDGPGWAVVRWETGRTSAYPIGATGRYALRHDVP